jgi:hypothetical protein
MRLSDLIDYYVVTPHGTVIELGVIDRKIDSQQVMCIHTKLLSEASDEDKRFFEQNCAVVQVARIKSLNMFKEKADAYALLLKRLNDDMFRMKDEMSCLSQKIKQVNRILREESMGG